MRLLNVDTLEFGEFFDADIPPYTILSHRWGTEEVSYKDFKKGRMKDSAGYRKILACCAKTRERRNAGLYRQDYYCRNGGLRYRKINLRWTWIDTCCIDKRSSAELSEAINSMFRWYAEAAECYVHLSDVSPSRHTSVRTTRDKFLSSDW